MKYLLIILPILFGACNTTTNTNSNIEVKSKVEEAKMEQGLYLFPIYINFNSVCCGTTSTKPLIKFTQTFLESNNLSFEKIYRISPLGREGEFAFGFKVDQWSENQKKQFVDGVKKITWENQEKNSFGGVAVNENIKFDVSKYMSMTKVKELSLQEFITNKM